VCDWEDRTRRKVVGILSNPEIRNRGLPPFVAIRRGAAPPIGWLESRSEHANPGTGKLLSTIDLVELSDLDWTTLDPDGGPAALEQA
jgi:hypothetical protein